MMKVIIVDDEKAMHLILTRMLAKLDGVEVMCCFQETATAFSFLTEHKVDLLFVDINMRGENGLDFSRRVRESGCASKIVFVTSYKEYALAAFDVFAFDYIIKPISEERLRMTVQRAYGEIVDGVEGNRECGSEFGPLIDPLTRREIEILQLISNGLNNKEIASHLKLKEGTIKNHIVNIFSKLQVRNRIQAITAGKSIGVIK
ncbi:response regulator transcription factor [Neobacillus sp. FSL H8-0543]|uniref:response regulator transcription factor n=1 Tax=Neobacillus sp. FSL H8-0543 TaxID=2954672 RepID=UPI0031583C18